MEMEEEIRYIVGSRAFFGNYEDFKSKDFDYLILVEEPTDYEWRYELSLRGQDFFYYKKEDVSTMIQKTIDSEDALLIGKFLIPEVAEAIGATVQDILPLEVLLPKLDDKHEYVKIIFNAIKENNSFELTDEQRVKAYESYKKTREKLRKNAN